MLSPFLITVNLVAADRSVGGAPESVGDGIGEVLRTGERSCARVLAASSCGRRPGAGDASRSWTGLAAQLVPGLDGVVGAGSCLERDSGTWATAGPSTTRSSRTAIPGRAAQ